MSATQIKDEFIKIYKQKISLRSIYAILNFLQEYGLSNSYNDNGTLKYELNLTAHHDHLICQKCGLAKSFYDEEIENTQEKICTNSNFKLISHTMILYGICPKCQLNDNDTQKTLSKS